MAERYGKANGNGPLHLLADFDGKTVTLCGVKRFTDRTGFSPSRHGVCDRCESVRRATFRPDPTQRPAGPDLITPAVIEARAEVLRAAEAYRALIALHRRAFAWMRDFPEERKAFIEQMRAAGVTLDAIGELLGVTREYVRQLAAS